MATGKIWRPEHAEAIVQGKADLVGMARQLLADPDWPRKVRDGRQDTIVFCEYGNVCKALDESFQRVRCTLWPKDALHAPESRKGPQQPAPRWPDSGPGLSATCERGRIRLNWERAVDVDGEGIYGYELFRAEGSSGAGALAHHASVRAATPTFLDTEVLGGVCYTYAVQPYDRRGVRGPRSAPLTVQMPATATANNPAGQLPVL